MTKEEKIDFCRKWIKKLNDQYKTLDSDRQEALKFCRGDPSIVDLIKGRSEIVTTDMQDAINTAKPDILETIAGIDEPLKLDPTGAEDVEPVKRLQILSNIMVKRKNPWFRRCSDFLDDSMKLKFGAFKYQWFSKESEFEKEYRDLDDLELQAKMITEGAELVKDEYETPDNGGIRRRTTVIRYKMTDEYVKIDTVPAERIKFPLDTTDFDSCPFVYEEVQLYKHQFIANYGRTLFEKIEKIRESLQSPTPNAITQERFRDVGGLNFLYDTKEDKYKVYECYFPNEEDSKPWMFIFIGDEAITDELNKYMKPPYRGGSPFLLAHRLLGAGYFDYLREIQRQRTFFKRQIFDNVSQANYRRYFADSERLNLDDYLNNNATNALIRVQGDPREIVMPEQKAPLPPEVLSFWELLNVEKDLVIPTPRAYAGVEVPGRDERTYRGKQLKVTQASKKLLMMIRSYMEDVFGPLFKDVVDCILKFMKKSTVIRYLNEDYEITPDNIIGKYDLVVNVGLGSHDKLDMIGKLQQLIGLAETRGMETGVITSQNIYYMYAELVKAMGFLNTTDFVTNPKLKESVMMVVQLVMQIPELSQQAAPLIQQIMAGFGIRMQEQQGGENMRGTFPGQNTAPQAELSMQPIEARTTPDGGGFYA